MSGALVLLYADQGLAQCVAPSYVVGRVWEDTPSKLSTAVSVDLAEFSRAKLACLGARFRSKYANRRSIEVLVFSSRDAARRYNPVEPDNAPIKESSAHQDERYRSPDSQLHAQYLYERDTHEEYLIIKPVGSIDSGPEDTKINLSTRGASQCRLELRNRCVVALDDIIYPGAAYAGKAGGLVTLAATIDRNGTVTKARVVEPAATSNEAIASLAVEALNNLKTWHLEPASRTDDVQLSYEYTMDLGLRAGEVTAHFDLPDRIRIRANPTKR